MKSMARKINGSLVRRLFSYISYNNRRLKQALIAVGISLPALLYPRNSAELMQINQPQINIPQLEQITKKEEQPSNDNPLLGWVVSEYTATSDKKLIQDISPLADSLYANNLEKTLKKVNRYSRFIDKASQEHNLEANLIRAIAITESKGNPYAKSPKGARGLMQLMPETAKRIGLSGHDTFVPERNIHGGSKYFNALYEKYNNPVIALAAYNWGEGNVDRQLNSLKIRGLKPTWKNLKPRLPPETQEHVPKVFAAYAALTSHQEPTSDNLLTSLLYAYKSMSSSNL